MLDSLSNEQVVALLFVGASLMLALIVAALVRLLRPRKRKSMRIDPQAAARAQAEAEALEAARIHRAAAASPFASEPPQPTTAVILEERSAMSDGGQFALVVMLIVNGLGLVIVFASSTYAESSVFGQLANILARGNGLLIIVILNQLLMCGLLLGRKRTFIMKKSSG